MSTCLAGEPPVPLRATGISTLLHIHRLGASLVLRALQYAVADRLRLQRVAEGRMGRRALVEPFDEVGDLMHERVLVADLQARYPPVFHVGMIAVGDMDAAPAAELALVAVGEIVQAVQ